MTSISAMIPLIIIVGGALLTLLLEVFLKKENKNYLAYISLAIILGSAFTCIRMWDKDYSYFSGYLSHDNISLFFSLLVMTATVLVILISIKYIVLQDANHGEYYSLILFALSGMMIMLSSTDFLVVFLGLEILSMSSYALAGLRINNERSSEAALKYFLLGSFASAFLVYGLALIFGAVHSLQITEIISYFQSQQTLAVMALAGLGMIIVGFGFKIAVVPFHMWTPDVYQGAPTPITAFFSIGPKVVGLAVFFRLLFPYLKNAVDGQIVFNALWIISVLTMIVGNLIALRQTNIKRMLAYSSIAHAGYILIAVLSQDTSGLLFYFVVYVFMNIGAFSAVIAMGRKGREYEELEDYAGIGFKYPWIGATFSLFLLSLAGFPPTGGFLAKFYIFSAAVNQGHISIVIIGVLASLISVYYYLRVVVYMYMREETHPVEINTDNPALFMVLFLCLYGVLQLGIFPGNILILIKQMALTLGF